MTNQEQKDKLFETYLENRRVKKEQERDVRDYVANQCCKSRQTRMNRKGR